MNEPNEENESYHIEFHDTKGVVRNALKKYFISRRPFFPMKESDEETSENEESNQQSKKEIK